MKSTPPKLTREQLSLKLEAVLLRTSRLEQHAFFLAEELRLLRIKNLGASPKALKNQPEQLVFKVEADFAGLVPTRIT